MLWLSETPRVVLFAIASEIARVSERVVVFPDKVDKLSVNELTYLVPSPYLNVLKTAFAILSAVCLPTAILDKLSRK